VVTGSGSHDLLAGRSGHPEARASTLRFIASVDVGRSFTVIQVGFWLSNQLMVSSWSLDLAAPGSSMTDRAALRRMKFPSTPASSAGSLLRREDSCAGCGGADPGVRILGVIR
jgi:hypothetical protein